MKLKPKDGYIVAIIAEAEQTKAGIYLPDSEKQRKKYLQVDTSASKLYKKGDFIVPKSGMMELELEMKKFFILHEDDICATIEE